MASLFAKLLQRESRSGVSAHPRDPVLAEWFGNYSRTASGVSVTPATARQCAEVDACISLNEDTLSTVPLDFYERRPDGGRERRDDHRLHQLLHDRPNDWMTSAEFRAHMEGQVETEGNAYARIVMRHGLPDALEPLAISECRPFRSPSGGVALEWRPNNGGKSYVLMPDEFLHLKDKLLKPNLIEGDSRVTRHRETIGLAMATVEYLSRFFSNYATPKTALVSPGLLTDTAAQQLQDTWDIKHAGLENAHRIALLQGGLDIKTIGATNEDSQVIESYQLAVQRIARIWGVPQHLIGAQEKTTSWGTGIEQLSLGYLVYFMRPKFVRWEQALNAALMSSEMRRRFYFEFNADGLLRGDFKSRMDGYAVLIQWGLASINEIRQLMNLVPVEGGEERMHPLNMAPATKIMDVLMRKSGGQAANADQLTRDLITAIAELRGLPRAA